MEQVHVSLDRSSTGLSFVLRGGAPEGRDVVHTTVKRWPGWRRIGLWAKLGSRPCSAYRARAWTAAAASLLACKTLDIRWEPDARELAQSLLKRLEHARYELAHPQKDLPFQRPTARMPLPHQAAAIRAIANMGHRALLADDMGLGKSSVALWCAENRGLPRLIIVCPVTVKWNWEKELRATLGSNWRCMIIHGTRTQRADQFVAIDHHAREESAPDAIAINYDLLIRLTIQQEQILKDLAPNSFLILDECHYVKNRNAERSKKVHDLFSQAPAVLGLTGTPIRNMVDDLFNQVEILRPGTWTSYTDFSRRHLVIQPVGEIVTQRGHKKTIRKPVEAKNVTALKAVVNTMQIRRFLGEVTNLPPKIHTYPEIELDEPTRKAYEAMRDYALVELSALDDDANIFHPQVHGAVQQALRCEQLAQGFVGGLSPPVMQRLSEQAEKHAASIPNRPNELVFPRSAKLVWLMEALESIKIQGGKSVVFTKFNAPLFWLQNHLPKYNIAPAVLHGGISGEDRHDIIDAFQKDCYDTIIVQVKVAEGFNLTNAQNILFLGRDWAPAINRQAEGRCHRLGQKGTVNIQVPIVKGTIETKIHKRLQAKDADAMNALASMTVGELKEAL